MVDFGISEVGIVGSRNTLTAACKLNASVNDPQENKWVTKHIYIYNNSAHKSVESSLCTQWRPTPLIQPRDHLEEEILPEHGHMLCYCLNIRLMHAL